MESKEGFDEFILDSFRYIGGRRFHNVFDAKYFFPNDIGEIDRLQGEHYLLQHIWKGDFSSPVQKTLRKPGATVLDVGCGPGSWVIDMARAFPSAIFIGLDISPIFPSEQKKLPNASFLQSNLLNGLPFPEGTFDFIHQRFLNTALEESQWKDEVILELIRKTKPGVEGCKSGEPFSQNYHKLFTSFSEFLAKRNINLKICPIIENILRNNMQLQNVKHERRSVPIGKWGGRLAIKPSLSRFMGITHEEFDKTLQLCCSDLDSSKYSWNISSETLVGEMSSSMGSQIDFSNDIFLSEKVRTDCTDGIVDDNNSNSSCLKDNTRPGQISFVIMRLREFEEYEEFEIELEEDLDNENELEDDLANENDQKILIRMQIKI
ncbi:11671_t:CDS:2 [Diversispora eburnea]|uniref:11671_t:CDS:1 n=1 Tax=Diversispora eburnea TaxID=1213867 RepID=A0A9N9B0J3_9GLOM|nr:11671_t:CDS:2 [Diversispora eburnea]